MAQGLSGNEAALQSLLSNRHRVVTEARAANRAGGGRPAYHPAALLKDYINGYLNRIQSTRRLEQEAQRNLELIWLTGTKTLPRVRTEFSLAVRSYNMKRMINIMGTQGMIRAIAA